MKSIFLSILTLTGAVLSLTLHAAEVFHLPVWDQAPPEENGLSGPEKQGGCIGNISQASLSIHLPQPNRATGIAVVITPGGGYGVVCADSEGEQIAAMLARRGIAGIVVKYRLPNQHHKIPAEDARRAIQIVRAKAREWRIHPGQVGIWGFSAGGHLASTVSNTFVPPNPKAEDPIQQHGSRPDFSILFYPVISMKTGITHRGSRNNLLGPDASEDLVQQYSNELQVSGKTPPTFLLHAADDKVVSIENTLSYYQALLAHSIPARLVAFETGGHGPNAFHNNPSWAPIFDDWIMQRLIK